MASRSSQRLIKLPSEIAITTINTAPVQNILGGKEMVDISHTTDIMGDAARLNESFPNELITDDFQSITKNNHERLKLIGVENGEAKSLLKVMMPLSNSLQNELLKECGVNINDRTKLVTFISEVGPEVLYWKESLEKIEEVRKDFDGQSWASIINFCVFLNFFSDFIGDPIQEDNMEKILNVYALIASLMLGASVALPMSVEYDEMEDAQLRYVAKGSFEGEDYNLPGDLSFNALLAIMSFGAALLIAVFVYHGLAQATFNDVDGKFSTKLYKTWWNYIRFSLLAAMVMIVIGILTFFFALQKLYMIKFPNPGCTSNSCWELGPDTPWQSSEYMAWIFLFGMGIGFGVVVPSIGLRQKNLIVYNHLRNRDDSRVLPAG